MFVGRSHKHVLPLLFALLLAAASRCPAQKSASLPSPLPAPSQPAPSISIESLGRGTVALDGPWQFQIGDNPAWASPAFDDSPWQQIDASLPWGDQGHTNYSGFAWYRRHLTFPPSADAFPQPEIALYLPKASCLYEVYWNGLLVSDPTPMPSSPIGQFSPTRVLRLAPAREAVLAIRVWTAPLDSSSSGRDTGLMIVPRLGNVEAATNLKTVADRLSLESILIHFAQILLYAQIVLFGFLAWLRNREQTLLKWMILFFLTCILSLASNPQIFPWLYSSPVLYFSPGYTLEDIALWYLLMYLLDLDQNSTLRRWTAILASLALFCAFADNLIFVMRWGGSHVTAFQILDAIFTIGFSAPELLPLCMIGLAIRKRLPPARWLVAAAAFLSVMYDVIQHTAVQGRRFTHLTLGETMLTPLFTVDQVQITAQSVLSALLVCSITYAVYRYSLEEGQRQSALRQEFKSAQELQRLLIPENPPALPGYAVTSSYRPADEVGGDFFQLIPRPDGTALLLIGDVSGKGLKSAMTVSMLVGAIRSLIESTDDPAEILAGLNRRLHNRLADGLTTCLALRLTPDGDCTLANAGHLAPFLNGQELALDGSLPLGVLPEITYDAIAIPLAVGDRLTLFTDGLLEARNLSGELYGFERLTQFLATSPDARQATQAAIHFGQQDDITILTLTRLATGEESTTSLIAPPLIKTKT